MKVLFLTDGPQNPAGRFRCEQFFPTFERLGVECHERYAYGHHYNQFVSTPLSTPYRTFCRLRRAAWTVLSPGYDLVFFQRTAIPVTALPEQLRTLTGTPSVFDFDDAIYLGADGRPDPHRDAAFRSAVALSSWVIAGNSHLARVAGAPDKTAVIPTVVDVDALVPPAPRPAREVVIGWMGTSSNFVHVRAVLPQVLAAIRGTPNARFRLVSNRPMPELASEPRTEFIPWTEAREAELLQSFDIGLMPLLDAEISRGKCAFKILQYMAVGSAVVASAVGANIDVLADSRAGILIPPGSDWARTLIDLALDRRRREEMGRHGRSLVVDRFSIASVSNRYIELFERLTSKQ